MTDDQHRQQPATITHPTITRIIALLDDVYGPSRTSPGCAGDRDAAAHFTVGYLTGTVETLLDLLLGYPEHGPQLGATPWPTEDDE